ncbi:spore coat protein CotS [Clostridium peptidivorans]|uniref:spore coat protein CotS n=1 Tax=Clostridium peptidivorans TaxID=100174 RepID=UPI000BE37D2A|nr:spore coat protein CotS [Clostridium peptidivorans]
MDNMMTIVTFEQYLKDKNIDIVDKFNYDSIVINEESLIEQMKIIDEFHKRTMRGEAIFKNRLESTVGKLVEDFKVGLKKLKREEQVLKSKEIENEFEGLLLNNLEFYIQRAEKSIKTIYENGYLDLIRRSMKNKEISIGTEDFINLTEDKILQIKNPNKCSYDMVEVDCFHLLRKYKKKKYELDYERLIREFCSIEFLMEDSYSFIAGLLSYPYEFVRISTKYRKKHLTPEECLRKLVRAMEQDGDSII